MRLASMVASKANDESILLAIINDDEQSRRNTNELTAFYARQGITWGSDRYIVFGFDDKQECGAFIELLRRDVDFDIFNDSATFLFYKNGNKVLWDEAVELPDRDGAQHDK